jgi:hypothetical protein
MQHPIVLPGGCASSPLEGASHPPPSAVRLSRPAWRALGARVAFQYEYGSTVLVPWVRVLRIPCLPKPVYEYLAKYLGTGTVRVFHRAVGQMHLPMP